MTSRMPLLPPPPPLPSSFSTRFLCTINPQTGTCKRHPNVQLCKLAQNNSRWVVRRKVCSKCGARAPVGERHTPGVSVRVNNPILGTRSQSAPPASDRHQSVTPARRRQSCDERQGQGDAAPNPTATSFKSRTISTGSMSFRSASAGTSTDHMAIELCRKPDALRNKKSDKKKYSFHNDDAANEDKHTSRRGRKKDTLLTANFDDASPAQVRFAIPPNSALPYIPPPPFHREIPSHYHRRKQSSINSMEDDIIKNVGCIYFYPMS